MMMMRSRAMRVASSSLLVLACCVVAASPAAAAVVVEDVQKSSPGDLTGLLPGDVIVSWSRAATPPANREPAGGLLRLPLDLQDVEIEQIPRGTVLLQGRRGSAAIEWTMAPGY